MTENYSWAKPCSIEYFRSENKIFWKRLGPQRRCSQDVQNTDKSDKKRFHSSEQKSIFYNMLWAMKVFFRVLFTLFKMFLLIFICLNCATYNTMAKLFYEITFAFNVKTS